MRIRNSNKGYVGLSFYLWSLTILIAILIVGKMGWAYEQSNISYSNGWIYDCEIPPLTKEEAKDASKELIIIQAKVAAYDVSVRLNTANKRSVDVFYEKVLSLMTPSLTQSQKKILEERSKLIKTTNIVIADETTITELKGKEIPEQIRKSNVQEGEYYFKLKGVLTVYKHNDHIYKTIASIPFCQYMHLVPVERTPEHPYGFLVNDIFEKPQDRLLDTYLYNYSPRETRN